MIIGLLIASVFIAEMFNTAIEAVIDMIQPEFHPLAKLAKDIAAGAVLVAAMSALVLGCAIFYSRL